MTLTLRQRILLTLAPLLVLLAVLGTAGVVLLHDLGGRIDLILRDNYESIIAMERLNEALERIDSSFQFALAGEDKAQEQFEKNWKAYREALWLEQHNITLPGEQELVDHLDQLTEKYHQQGTAFYAAVHLRRSPEHYYACLSLLPAPALAPGTAGERAIDLRRTYFAPGGLLATFGEIKTVSGKILLINQENMTAASRDVRQTAANSLIGFAIGLAVAVLLAGIVAWHTIQTILQPISAVTQAAKGIRVGNLDQLVPYHAHDELGELADEFNLMARYLRDHRHSHSAQLLRVQRTSQATINSFPDPVLVVDTEGIVEMANPAAQRLLGVVPRKPGQPPAPPWQPPDALRVPLNKALQGHLDYQPEEFDQAVLLNASGSEGAYLPRILTIHDPYGNPLGAAVLLQDVTRFRLLDQLKTDLVATVSHELKTPLTSLQLDLHLVLEETVGPLEPKQLELLLDVRDNAGRLLEIVNNLLDLARLQERRGQLALRPESPAEMLHAAADTVRPRVEDKGVELVIEAPPDLPRMAADAAQLRHALDNLLDNAITYTDRGGRIAMTAEQEGNYILLKVTDNGQGIPPEYLPRLFDRFFRVPGQSRGQGTGLGLSIVREIVTAQGGSIECESHPGTGTMFRLKFPVWSEGDQHARR